MDVTGFAFYVLAGLAASYGCIELWTTVAGADDDGFFYYGTQGFKDFGTEGSQRWNEVLKWGKALGMYRFASAMM